MFINREKEMQQLDYDLKVKEIDKILNVELLRVKELFSENGFLCEKVHFPNDDKEFSLCAVTESGVFVFYKSNKEITDFDLYKESGMYHKKILASLEGLNEHDLTFYLLLNTPITQKASYALYNPNMEFFTPVADLFKTIEVELQYGSKKYGIDEMITFANILKGLSEERKKPLDSDTYFENKEGRFVKKRGIWHKLSDIDAETYFCLLLFGGLFGIHKFYVKKFGSGLGYLFTLGFCGVGWFFDMIEVMFNIARDKNGLYIGHFENKKEKLLVFLLGIPFVALFLFGVGFLVAKFAV